MPLRVPCALLLCMATANGLLDRRPPPFSLRLVGGSSPNRGRVEVNSGNGWGTVCSDDWSSVDATVVCRQLGYTGRTAYLYGHFGPGSGGIFLDNVACGGNESTLAECRHSGWGVHSCEHSDDAGVGCYAIERFETPPGSSCDGDNDLITILRTWPGRGSYPEACARSCLAMAAECVAFNFDWNNRECYRYRVCDTTSSLPRVQAYIKQANTCPEPPSVRHGRPSSNGPYEFTAIVTYECADGYELHPAGEYIQCLASGQWTQGTARCRRSRCRDGPCFDGVSCEDVPAPGSGFRCGPCPPGYSGNGQTCLPLADVMAPTTTYPDDLCRCNCSCNCNYDGGP